MFRRPAVLAFVTVGIFVANAAVAADLVEEALASFPTQTLRLEYSHPSKLRALPGYDSLRQRYMAQQLEKLEASLAGLGIRERDIDELTLGWQVGGGGWDLFGLATGKFDSQAVSRGAAAHGMSPEAVLDQNLYCFGADTAATCVVLLTPSLGAFGSRTSLSTLISTRQGGGANLGSNLAFAELVKEAHSDAPIWGVGVGAAVADWFRAWMPSQKEVTVDWTSAFQSVESLAYSVEAGQNVTLNMKMDCATPEAAANLKQVLDGLKMFQQMAWQNQNPNLPNPFQSLQTAVDGRRTTVALTTQYAALQGSLFGTP